MAQATLTGPRDHPLTNAERVVRIETTPADWIHADSDHCPCSQCGESIPLGDGGYLVVTLEHHEGRRRRKDFVRFCGRDCYGDWASDGLDVGW